MVRLSEYLKEHQDTGIRLKRHGNIPALIINPGIHKRDDQKRWHVLQESYSLFMDAIEELMALMRTGKIQLTEAISDVPDVQEDSKDQPYPDKERLVKNHKLSLDHF